MSKKNKSNQAIFVDEVASMPEEFNPVTFEKDSEVLVEQMETVVVPEKKIKIGVVTAPMLNVREKPLETSNPFMILTEGVEVEVDDSFKDSKWFKVKTGTGSIGYVVQEYIKVK